MTVMETILGKGWAGKLITEPKDDKWSYGFGKAIILMLLIASVIYFVITAYSPNANILTLSAIMVSALFLTMMLGIADYEERNENSKGIGFAFFSNLPSFLIQVSVGVTLTALLIFYLGYSFCHEPRLVSEGYCVQTSFGQAGILPQQTFSVQQLAMPFYGIVLAPFTEEMFFRVFVFYTLLNILPNYFRFFSNMKNKYPIVFFLIVAVMVNSGFGTWHYATAQNDSCKEQGLVCVYDRVWTSNIYGMLWLGGNQIFGGWGFSVAGHVLNNMLGYKLAIADLFIFVIAPMILFGFLIYKVYQYFVSRRRR